MKNKFDDLKKDKLFREAVWMHIYHQNIQNKKIDVTRCPICQTPAVLEIEASNEKS